MERWRSGRLVNAVKSANAERKRQLLPSVQVLSRLLGLSVKAKFGCDRQQARNNNSVNETALPRTQTGVSTPSPEAASYRWSLRHPQHGLRLADPPAAPGAPSRAQDEGQSGQGPLPLLKDPSCNQHGCSLPPGASTRANGHAAGKAAKETSRPCWLWAPRGCVTGEEVGSAQIPSSQSSSQSRRSICI